jgi:hypothetical protein
MMAAYLKRTNGRMHLAELLQAAGKRQTDLPTLPQYVHPNGKPFLCWSSVLGRCTFHDCRFLQHGGHPLAKAITDEFTNKVVDTLNKGVISLCGIVTPAGLPPKNQKSQLMINPNSDYNSRVEGQHRAKGHKRCRLIAYIMGTTTNKQ